MTDLARVLGTGAFTAMLVACNGQTPSTPASSGSQGGSDAASTSAGTSGADSSGASPVASWCNSTGFAVNESALPDGPCAGEQSCELLVQHAQCAGLANGWLCSCANGTWACRIEYQGTAVCPLDADTVAVPDSASSDDGSPELGPGCLGSPGASCSAYPDGTLCPGPSTGCVSCGLGRYTFAFSFCSCTSGIWNCHPPAAGDVQCPSAVGTFIDSACSELYGSDAGVDGG